MREGTFPEARGRHRGECPVAWKLSSILAWIDALPEQRLLGDPERATSNYVRWAR